MSGGNRSSRRARAVGVASAFVLAATMALAVPPAASAAPALHPAMATAQAAPGVKVWHEPRLTKIAQMARQMTTMDIPYSNGGHGSEPAAIGSSVDCSGLIRQLYYYAYGVDIGQGTGDSMVRTSGKFVKTSTPVPGDVILFGQGGYGPAYHLMIYVGNDGGQPTAVASPDWGQIVKYQHPESPYWTGELMGYWHYRGADAQDSAASLAQPKVKVKLLSTSSGDGRMKVTGYAFDPVNPSLSVTVDVYASGHRVARVVANKPSPGTNKAYRITGDHRVEASIPMGAGTHPTRLLAHNIPYDGVADAWSAQGYVTVKRTTVAAIWSTHVGHTADGHGTLRVVGYGFDRLARDTAPQMQVLVDGTVRRTFTPNQASPEMNRIHDLSGDHRFDITVEVSAGRHTVQARTLPIATYSRTGASAKVRSGFVPRKIPAHYDSLTAKGSSVVVKAWAFPPYHTGGTITFAVTLDGKARPDRVTGVYRADVNQRYDITGRHGISVAYPVKSGSHTLCLRPRRTAPETVGISLGCKTVTVTG